MVQVNVFWSRPQAYYDRGEWRGTWELDGGALMNQATRFVDLLDWLIGAIADVQAMTSTLGRNSEVEDFAVMSIRRRSGALGSMSVTMLPYPRDLEGSITILAEKGTVRVGASPSTRSGAGSARTRARTIPCWRKSATRPPESTASDTPSTTTT